MMRISFTCCLLLAAVRAIPGQSIEDGLLPAYTVEGEVIPKWKLADRMAFHKVPAVSIAVMRHGRIAWAKAYGVIEAGSNQRTKIDTLFQAASISKPVASTGVMTLVQKGRLGLDDNVNGTLTSWKVPDNEFTTSEKVTLRRLLSHSAGMTVHGFPGYAADAPVPTVVQILNGEKPANTEAVRVETVPGSKWNYSGGGITVMQQLVTDLTSKPFPEFMRETVLGPFGMTRSTYQQPLPEALRGNAARAHQGDGKVIAGLWHTYPEMAAAGLWTTPSDLARFAIAIRRAARGELDKVISAETARAILTRQKGDWGLGFELSGAGSTFRFGHGGSNAGYRCQFTMYLESGDGIAVMTNSDAGDALIGEVLRSAAAAYGWPDFQPVKKKIVSLAPAVLASYAGDYEMKDAKIKIRVDRGTLWIDPPGGGPAQMLPETETQFFITDGGLPVVKFLKDGDGKVTGFQLFDQTARRVPATR